MNLTNTIRVRLWGTTIGYLHQESNGMVGFQYDKAFLNSGIQVSPIRMPLSDRTYMFPSLPEGTFHGLPGMVADSLPDRFGTAVINRYLESQGRTADSLSVIEKLCYTGRRGMGALEYEPANEIVAQDEPIEIDALAKLAADVLSEKEKIYIEKNDRMMAQLMESGSSVGGARAKTLIAWNPETNIVRSGQINPGDGYDYWLLKFGNIPNNKDKDARPDDGEYTKIEYAYYLMAKAAGIPMKECRLYEEKGISHFMTRRFDRIGAKGEKLHMQSLCALAHMDFNSPRIYSYEEAFSVMKRMKLPYNDFLQLFSRMVFNDRAKNYDDHTKNISFLMDKRGQWSLSPAYDITFSYRKDSMWVNAHQMLINGKSEHLTVNDFMETAKFAGIKKSDVRNCIEQIEDAVQQWESFAQSAKLSESNIERVKAELRV